MARPSLRRAVLLLALAPSSSRRTIQLVNEDGKVVMTPEDASCQACHRVLAHLANRTELSVDKVPGGGGAASASRRKQREDAVNMELYVSQVLDSKSCLDEMSEHDLGHVDGKQMFVRKEAGGHNAYPVHMDLNQKAKTELANFCFAFIEENEDALEELIRAGANLTDEAICRDQLNYCAPPPPPPPPPPRKKRAHTERPMNQEQRRALTKKAREVFALIDADSDGWLSRDEVGAHTKAVMLKAHGRRSMAELIADVDEVFRLDTDGDGRLSFTEYKASWVPPKFVPLFTFEGLHRAALDLARRFSAVAAEHAARVLGPSHWASAYAGPAAIATAGAIGIVATAARRKIDRT